MIKLKGLENWMFMWKQSWSSPLHKIQIFILEEFIIKRIIMKSKIKNILKILGWEILTTQDTKSRSHQRKDWEFGYKCHYKQSERWKEKEEKLWT